MTAIEYLLQEVKCILKPSRINGVGFIAVRDIEIGEVMFKPWLEESGIYSITHDELFSLPQELQDNIYETFHHKISYINKEGIEISIPKEYGRIFFPLEKGCHWIYVWPKMFMNSGLDRGNVNSNDYTLPVVIRKIRRGDEVLGNYGSQFRTKPKNFI